MNYYWWASPFCERALPLTQKLLDNSPLRFVNFVHIVHASLSSSIEKNGNKADLFCNGKPWNSLWPQVHNRFTCNSLNVTFCKQRMLLLTYSDLTLLATSILSHAKMFLKVAAIMHITWVHSGLSMNLRGYVWYYTNVSSIGMISCMPVRYS